MSDWETKRFPPRTAKRPPPAHGIKIKKAGTTWWGQRWIAALREVLRGQPGRLERGATYARAGRTHDLRVEGGKVVARVTGSRSTPYEVRIELRPIPGTVWDAAIREMAKKAQFSAELLAGEMPVEIDDVFSPLGASLFPRERSELETECSCPDWGDPCKHVAATHYVLGEALDRDPFLLFELRGRTKDEVLAALRAARGASVVPDRKSIGVDAATVTLQHIAADDYDKPRTPLPALQFSFDEPEEHGALLRQLGAPAAWNGEQTPAETLAPLVRAAAENARRIALAPPREESLREDDPPKAPATARKLKSSRKKRK
ncbi:MAG TPA: SWIM zinc finger family protein [Polyangiaceae bacterium]|nr:SWIM zinc finger family protein [Polyangiaceae bacterium]